MYVCTYVDHSIYVCSYIPRYFIWSQRLCDIRDSFLCTYSLLSPPVDTYLDPTRKHNPSPLEDASQIAVREKAETVAASRTPPLSAVASPASRASNEPIKQRENPEEINCDHIFKATRPLEFQTVREIVQTLRMGHTSSKTPGCVFACTYDVGTNEGT